jgi:hypothetical protein
MSAQELDDGWAEVEAELTEAKGIAWDTCHKIYILMDEEQMAQMREYGYDPLIPISHLDAGNPDRSDASLQRAALAQLHEWYNDSCGLRFINSVRTNREDPNEGFTSLIRQFASDEEDEDAWGDGWGDEEDDD